MYSKFHGTNGQTAARWLRTLKFELETDRTHPYELNNGDWLQLIDGLLEGDAALWADQHPKVKELFSDERTKHATKNDVDTFKALFRERFAPLAENTEEAANIAEFRTLRQRPKEELQDYYRRAEDIFSGEKGHSALRWLRTLDHELPNHLTPNQWLKYVDGLLEGSAARWADQHPRIKKLLQDENLNADDGYNSDVKTFQHALCQRFKPSKIDEPLIFFSQQNNENLESYYRRAEARLHSLGGVDNDEDPDEKEREVLVRVIGDFVKGLQHMGLREMMSRRYEVDKNSTHGGIKLASLGEYYELSESKLKSLTFVWSLGSDEHSAA
ncbi:hypothetical protein P7C71_g6001, partial [Lecanoromycetidae sp. Uapishka_2]